MSKVIVAIQFDIPASAGGTIAERRAYGLSEAENFRQHFAAFIPDGMGIKPDEAKFGMRFGPNHRWCKCWFERREVVSGDRESASR